MENKYIVTDRNNLAIFSPTINHSDMVKVLEGKPLGAGFCYVYTEGGDVKVHCSGKSITLGIDSREEDSALLTRLINRE